MAFMFPTIQPAVNGSIEYADRKLLDENNQILCWHELPAKINSKGHYVCHNFNAENKVQVNMCGMTIQKEVIDYLSKNPGTLLRKDSGWFIRFPKHKRCKSSILRITKPSQYSPNSNCPAFSCACTIAMGGDRMTMTKVYDDADLCESPTLGSIWNVLLMQELETGPKAMTPNANQELMITSIVDI